jgi:hypothetical protein
VCLQVPTASTGVWVVEAADGSARWCSDSASASRPKADSTAPTSLRSVAILGWSGPKAASRMRSALCVPMDTSVQVNTHRCVTLSC